MSIFSDMMREIVKEEITNAIKEINPEATPEPTVTHEPEPTPEPTPEPKPEPTVTPALAFDMNAFRSELKNDLSKFMADALNGEVATVEHIDPDDALKAILGFDK